VRIIDGICYHGASGNAASTACRSAPSGIPNFATIDRSTQASDDASQRRNEHVDQADQCWDAVDRYLADLLVGVDPVLKAALTANSNAGLPRLDVSPLQGKLLHPIARLARA
jgi:hypothetical protein